MTDQERIDRGYTRYILEIDGQVVDECLAHHRWHANRIFRYRQKANAKRESRDRLRMAQVEQRIKEASTIHTSTIPTHTIPAR